MVTAYCLLRVHLNACLVSFLAAILTLLIFILLRNIFILVPQCMNLVM